MERDAVMMRTLEENFPSSRKKVDVRDFCQLPLIMYSSLLCQVKKLAEAQAYLRTNAKSKSERSLPAADPRVPTR